MEKRARIGAVILGLGAALAFAARRAGAASADASALWTAPAESGDGSAPLFDPAPLAIPNAGGSWWDLTPAAPQPAAEAPAYTEDSSPYLPYVPDLVPPASTVPDVNARLAALLAVIRQFESGGDYSVLFGGGHFSDFSTHPNVRVPFHNPLKAGDGNNDYSTAAGAYQINYKTWRDFAPVVGRADFAPDAQDALAVAILRKIGAYNALVQNDVQGAIRLAGSRWASLPGSTAQQGAKSMAVALAAFDGYLGVA